MSDPLFDQEYNPRWNHKKPVNPGGIVQHRAKLRAQRRVKIDRFAEMLADGWTLAAAASAVGVSQQSGTTYLAQMRRELGWQTVRAGAPVPREHRGRPDLVCAALTAACPGHVHDQNDATICEHCGVRLP